MKKLLLLSAVLAGGIAATQAGINFKFGIGLPLPAPRVAVRLPAPQVYAPPVVATPPVCEQPSAVYEAPVDCPPAVVSAPAVCEPQVYVQPRPVVIERDHYVYNRNGARHDWNRHEARNHGGSAHHVYRR